MGHPAFVSSEAAAHEMYQRHRPPLEIAVKVGTQASLPVEQVSQSLLA
jgi:hypothetical protein